MPDLVSLSDEFLVTTTAPGTQWVHHKCGWILRELFPSQQYQWIGAAVSSVPQSSLWTTSSTCQVLSKRYSLAFQKGPASTGMNSKPSMPPSHVAPLLFLQKKIIKLGPSKCTSSTEKPSLVSHQCGTHSALGL